MYKTFNEFNENRQTTDFGDKFATLCEAIAYSGVSFEKYWENIGLPTALQSTYMESEEELLDNFLVEFDWGKMNPMNWGKKQNPMANQPVPQHIKDMQAQADAQKNAMAQKLQAGQGRADAAVKNIMQKFQVSMRDFLKNVSDEAKQSNDRYSWQIAKMFHDKALKSMQNFAVQAKHGKDPMAAQFSQDRQAMQGQQQADLKQRLQQKHQGRQGTNPAAPVAQNIPQSNAATTSGNPTLAAAKKAFPTGAYMQAAHHEPEGDVLIESLVETYSKKPKSNNLF